MGRRPTSIRLSDAEIAELDARARKSGLTRSRFLRFALLGRPDVPDHAQRADHRLTTDQAEMIRQLNRIGNNLNQLVRASHSGDIIDKTAVQVVLDELGEAIRRVAT